MRYTEGIKHALTNHRKTFGISKTIKAAYLYHVILIKRIFLGNQQEEISVNGYQMHIIPHDKVISEELSMFKIHEPLNTKFLAEQLEELNSAEPLELKFCTPDFRPFKSVGFEANSAIKSLRSM